MARWRGRIEHVQSGEWGTFLNPADLVDFLRRFGVMTGEGDLPVAAEVHCCLGIREEDGAVGAGGGHRPRL